MIEEKKLPDHVIRVQEEKEELDIKVCALTKFIHGGNNDKFTKLSWEQRNLLITQLTNMQTYSRILGERLVIMIRMEA